jgi:hypothetical protein
MKKLFLLCFLATFASAQQYYQASGQTAFFTLTAGATAGPGGSAVRSVRPALSPVPHMLVAMQGGLHISLAGNRGLARIVIYNLTGKRVQEADITGNAMVPIRSDLGYGVYFARLEANGRPVQTTRFWKAR